MLFSFLKQSSESEIQKKNDFEPVIIKADVIKAFKSESSLTPSFDRYLSDELNELNGDEYQIDKTINGITVEKNQVLFRIEEILSHTEFLIKAPCSGKIFFLVQTKGYGFNNSVKADTSLAIIVPESWSKSQTVEWYRSVEPLEEPVAIELTTGESTKVKNLFPDDAFVLPDDICYEGFVDTGWSFRENYTTRSFCGTTGRIKYKESTMNGSYIKYSGTIAEIY